MVLVTNNIQSYRVAHPSRPLSWNGKIELKQQLTVPQTISRTPKCIRLKRAFSLRIASPFLREACGKPLKISSFKGNLQNEEAGNRSNNSKFPKNPVRTSYVSQDGDITLTESSNLEDAAVPCNGSRADGIGSRSQSIHRLFKKWLTLLHTESSNQVGDEVIEKPPQRELLQAHNGTHAPERGEILRVVLCYFLRLDATIKIPLLIFVPMYLAVNVVYGTEVSRELTPLWIVGPLVVALYVKILRGIFALYVFCFKQTVMTFKNLPVYYAEACKYVSDGKLKEDIRSRFWQPVVDVRNADYKELSMRKRKEFEEWVSEKYLDFVESVWPFYCRTIRFLKRANLI